MKTRPAANRARPRAKAQEIQKNRVRTWFAYYQAAIKLGRYKDKLKRSEPYYRDWGDVTAEDDFEEWWEDVAILFGRGVEEENLHPFPELLTISIPLYQNETAIIEAVRELVRLRQSELAKKQTSRRRAKNFLSTGIPSGPYEFTPGTEFRFGPANDALIIYLNFVGPGGELPAINDDLLKDVRAFFGSSKTLVLPDKLREDIEKRDESSALRNLRRYFERAEQLLEAAAIGQFPGKPEDA